MSTFSSASLALDPKLAGPKKITNIIEMHSQGTQCKGKHITAQAGTMAAFFLRWQCIISFPEYMLSSWFYIQLSKEVQKLDLPTIWTDGNAQP